jgi:transcriptional regulator with GAF, ATPase, and Fis domain
MTGLFSSLMSLPDYGGDGMKTSKAATDDDLLKNAIADFEKHIIVSALEQTGGNQSKAARRLRTTKRIIMYRVRKYGIDLRRFCKADDRNNGYKA